MASLINIRQTSKKTKKQTAIMVTIGLVAILTLAGAVTYWWVVLRPAQVKKDIDGLIQNAETLSTAGDATAALSKLKQAEAMTTDPAQKQTIYIKQAGLQTGNDKLDTFIRSYSSQPSPYMAANIAELADSLGKKDIAIEYYQKVIDANDENMYAKTFEVYKQRIVELKK